MMSSACKRLLSKGSLSPLRFAVRSSGGASNRSMSTAASPLRRRVLHSAYKSLQLSTNGKTSFGFLARPFSAENDVLDIDLSTTNSMEEKVKKLCIDLSTTNSMEEKIESAQGTLSMVAINHEGELLVETSAKQFEGSQTQTEMEMVPCKIVKAPNGGAWVEANGQKYSPFQIGAFLLAQMDGYAQEYRETTIRSFTVMVPACLRDTQIKVTFEIDHHNGVIVLAKNEASEKEMDLLPIKSYFLVEKWLSKYRENIPTEIVKEIEKAMSLYRRAQQQYCDHSFYKYQDKLKGARDALSKISQHMSKGSSSGGTDLGTTNSMEEKSENAQETLSVVAINREGELLVGTSAKQFEGSQTHTKMETVPCKIVKAPNGDAWVEANGRKYSPGQIGAFVVSKIKKFAEAHLGNTVTKAIFIIRGCLSDGPVKVSFSISPDNGVVTVMAEDEFFWKKSEAAALQYLETVQRDDPSRDCGRV
ncbi:PREDICTED: uncharacterized protein LOC104813241 isoform X2 [Tarenaya hassleriana]|uniref:uncharacterized protein LOC104813241 isoform X2 n=1 Tax=Tarenaya hassleriana TaxID=28532 RepID=UPI00053C51C9|nr:PREDICTED: uncharacterized protein LOC104813241 isoform X2 [Tarenaya hassleriana]